MAEPTHFDTVTGIFVLCCWACRDSNSWIIEKNKLITIDEAMAQEEAYKKQKQEKSESNDDHESEEEITMPYGFPFINVP